MQEIKKALLGMVAVWLAIGAGVLVGVLLFVKIEPYLIEALH